MNCPMRSGSSFGCCSPSRRGAGSDWTTARRSMGWCGSSRPGGLTQRADTVRPLGRVAPGSGGGPWRSRSSGCSRPPRSKRTRPGISTVCIGRFHRGPSPPPCCGGPERRAPRLQARTLPMRTDHQDPSCLRRPGTSVRLHRHRRQHQRLHPVHRGDGRDTAAPGRGGPGPGPTTPSETRATAPKRSAPGSGGGVSAPRPRNGPTRSATGSGAATAAGARQPSTSSSTSGATWSNAASTA